MRGPLLIVLYVGLIGAFYALRALARRRPSSRWARVLFGWREGLDLRVKGRPPASVRNNGVAFLCVGILHFALYVLAMWYLDPFGPGDYQTLSLVLCAYLMWFGALGLGGGVYLICGWLVLSGLGALKKRRSGGDDRD